MFYDLIDNMKLDFNNRPFEAILVSLGKRIHDLTTLSLHTMYNSYRPCGQKVLDDMSSLAQLDFNKQQTYLNKVIKSRTSPV